MSLKKELINLDKKEVLITGGTGTLGRGLVKQLITNTNVKGIRIFSRDEYKQWIMKQEFQEFKDIKNISFIIGDIRDLERLKLAMNRVDIVIHAAAMKHILSCEYNPIEAINTNIEGTKNVIYSSIYNDIEKAMLISSDKAVYPINLYGMTKAVGENLFINGNTYRGKNKIFSCCRYGNVLGSRGSVIELFKKQKEEGEITITNRTMTRFWITLEDVSKFILKSINRMEGGEIFVPKMPSMSILKMAEAIAPNIPIKEIGIRKGEKIHECLITKKEMANIFEEENQYIIRTMDINRKTQFTRYDLNSSNNIWELSKKELKELLEKKY